MAFYTKYVLLPRGYILTTDNSSNLHVVVTPATVKHFSPSLFILCSSLVKRLLQCQRVEVFNFYIEEEVPLFGPAVNACDNPLPQSLRLILVFRLILIRFGAIV